MNGLLLGIVVYVLVQLVVGAWVSRSIHTEADYLIAGRRIGPLLGTFTVFATWFGAETCTGAAGKFYQEGIAGGITDPFGPTLALILAGWIFARALWKRELTTLADLFRGRYGVGVERLSVAVMAPTSIFWAAAQIRAFGQILHSVSDVSVVVGITCATAVVIVYTFAGGLFADVMTDFVQGIAIIVGLVALVWAIGVHPEVSMAEAWKRVDAGKWSWTGGEGLSWKWVEMWGTTVMGSMVAQELVARFLGMRSGEVARNAGWMGGGMYLVIGLIPAFLGLVGGVMMPGLTEPEAVLPAMSQKFLPAFLQMTFIGALVSAILSTVDSALLAASSLVSHNLLEVWRPSPNEMRKVLRARVCVVVCGLAAYVMALGAGSIFELIQQANGIGTAGVFVLMTFGLYSKWGGAWAGGLALGGATLAWGIGTYWAGWETPFLYSLGTALGLFGVGAWWDGRRGRSGEGGEKRELSAA